MKARALLRLNRVFLSANPRNIEVFRALADHDDFRHQIVEIVWDDVQLPHDIPQPEDGIHHLGIFHPPKQEGIPYWYVVACHETHESQKMCNQEREIGIDLPLEESLSYYKQLLQQQDNVLAAGTDIEAFKYGLQRFKSLRRVILTAAAHGILDIPMYETPMIRSFPRGFKYPITHAWPIPDKDLLRYTVEAWDLEEEKRKWRGFNIITRELAKYKHRVSEFIVHVNELETGVNCRVFDKPCEEYNNLLILLQTPGFRRLDLVLLADGPYSTQLVHLQQYAWTAFRNGLLKRALEQMEDPRHVSIRLNLKYHQYRSLFEDYDMRSIPLHAILPVGRWQKLWHLGLSGMIVDIDGLISVLNAQPLTLRSVELSYLIFAKKTESYYYLLKAMRDTLGWRERVEGERPLVIIHTDHTDRRMEEQYECVDDYVNEYLYGEGSNPFDDFLRENSAPPATLKAVTRHRVYPGMECPNKTITTKIH